MDFLGLDEIPSLRAIAFGVAWIFGSLIVGSIAKNDFYRSFSGWTVLAFLFSPLVAGFFLFVAGPPLEAREQVEAEMAKRKKVLEDEGELFEAEKTCKVCGNVVNLATGEGLKNFAFGINEPFYCQKCNSPVDQD